MSEIVQSSYKTLMNYVYNHAIKKIPVIIRDILIQTVFFVFALYFVAFRSERYYVMLMDEQDLCHFIAAVLFLLVAVLSMHEEVTIVPWRRSLVIPYYALALGLVGIGLMHPIGAGYGFFGLVLLSAYPCLYIAWNNRGDYEELFDKIAIAFIIVGSIYFMWFSYADFTDTEIIVDGRHEGGLFNANFLSFLGVNLSCVALYYLYRCIEKKKLKIALSYSLIAILMGTVLIAKGESRSAILILTANIIIVLFFIVKKTVISSNVDRKKVIILLAIVAIAMIMLIIIGSQTDLFQIDRFDFRNKNPDEYSSGRVRLWSSYYHNLTLLGHDMSIVDWQELSAGLGTHHAHNNFLDYAYRCGIPIGICCVAVQLVAGIITLGIMFKRKANTGADVFVVIFSVQYLVLSLIDIATLPMTNYGAFMFYICLAPLLVSPDQRKNPDIA